MTVLKLAIQTPAINKGNSNTIHTPKGIKPAGQPVGYPARHKSGLGQDTERVL